MAESAEQPSTEPSVFASDDGPAPRPRADRRSLRRRAIALPIAVASTVAVALGFAQPAEAVPQPPKRMPRAKASRAASVPAVAQVAAVPAQVTVAEGDTVSGIAARYGLSTAEVLAANGLSWQSLIFPGQRLVLPGGAAPVAPAAPPSSGIRKHVVVSGDTISGIAAANGLTVDQVLSANGLGRQSLIFPGQAIVLPSPGADAPAPAPAAPAPAPPAPAGTHTVASGDTLWGIAQSSGVALDALLSANGLDRGAVIRPGQTLVIPGAPAPAAAIVPVVFVDMPMTDETRRNAKIIIEVGRRLGVPDQGVVVALAAAAQESGLKNTPGGDRDSLGLFQQRPSQGWGTADQVMDPVRAATAFYGGPANPNPGRTHGLLDIPNWAALTVTQAAQAVQRSAHPDHYAKWEQAARRWLSELG